MKTNRWIVCISTSYTYEPDWSPVIILFTRAGLRVTLLLLGGLICMNNGAVLCDTEKIRIHHPDTGRTRAPSAAIISWHLPRVTHHSYAYNSDRYSHNKIFFWDILLLMTNSTTSIFRLQMCACKHEKWIQCIHWWVVHHYGSRFEYLFLQDIIVCPGKHPYISGIQLTVWGRG